ncbi:MAG: bL21 family ribosomal protein, partial [Clostridia bacterium]|nr:bL21 family ribosomal protein [Clostridia bacterium]
MLAPTELESILANAFIAFLCLNFVCFFAYCSPKNAKNTCLKKYVFGVLFCLTHLAFCDKLAYEPHSRGKTKCHLTTLIARLVRGGKKMYAIVVNGGKQYKVEKDQILSIEYNKAEVGSTM